MKQLLIATHNPAKKKELKGGFSPLVQSGIKLLFLDDIKIANDPEETGKTFKENARLKAHYFASLSNAPTVADDGGIEIDALKGEPGVHSKRWLGKDATDAELIQHTIKMLKNIDPQKRTAQFTVCLFYYNPLTKYESSVTQSLTGHIALVPSGLAKEGFPYRALFIANPYNVYYDELSKDQHDKVNHRLKAAHKLIPRIVKDLNVTHNM